LLFSIVIPSYNRAGLIGHTIRSFLQQDYSLFELLVIDDGGTDNTKEVVASFNDQRIRYFFKENGERGAARNFGAARAVGDYISFFDSDDLVYPWYLSNAKGKLESLNLPECYAQAFEFRRSVSGNTPEINRSNDGITTINGRLRRENILACNGVFVRKDIFNNFSFSENRDLSGSEDWLLWLQIAAVYPFYFCPVVCSCLINHDERGELNVNPDKMKRRVDLLISFLKMDNHISGLKRREFRQVLANGHLFAALKLAEFKKFKFKSLSNLFKAFWLSPSIIGLKAIYITIIKLFFSWHS